MNPFMRGLVIVNEVMFHIAMVFLGCSAGLATINAITRKFFPGIGGFTWAEEMSTYFCVLMLFIGVAYLELINKHLTIGVIDTLVRNNEKLRRILSHILRIFRAAVTLFLLGLVVRYGFVVLSSMYASQILTFALRWPRFIFFVPMVIGLIMVLVVWVSLLIFNKGKELNYGSD